MKHILLALLLVGLGATAAQADDKFDKMDTNKDDKVTWEEFQAAYPQMTRAAFDAIDTNKDGSLSHDEWHKFLLDHQKGMGQSGGMGGGMPKADRPGESKPMITPPAKSAPAQ